MVVAIIALLASLAFPYIQIPMKHGRLASKRAWAKAMTSGFEAYFLDHNKYPQALPELIGATPPYVKTSVYSDCGFFEIVGTHTRWNNCLTESPTSFYQVNYGEELDFSVVLIEYFETRVKVDSNFYGCPVKAGAVYFHEMVDDVILRSSCNP